MPISIIKKSLIFSLFIFFFGATVQAQVVWENPKFEVYDFLSRQAQKGNIDFADFIQPISRKEIAKHLATLTDSTQELSVKEKKELDFYLKEYSEFGVPDTSSFFFLKKDSLDRLRFLSVRKDDFLVKGEPVLTLETLQGGGKQVFKKGNGLQFWGHMGKNFGFQFYFQDFTESGEGVDKLKDFNSEQGIVRTNTVNPDRVSYSDIRGYMTYNWKNGSISAGKDNLLWGYGRGGRVILSDKAPSYPFIRFDYRPLKWLSFQYSHAWLQSGMIDSNKTYPTGNQVFGGKREFYIQKFMATHSLNFFPAKGLSFSVGESMIYSDKLNVAYLMPMMFFKAYDHYTSKHNITAGSNGQFYLQASSRNHIPNTHIYANMFIDEIRTSSLFDRSKSRNQLGYTLGASFTDLLPYLTLGYEYTRVNPFVYQNLIGAQSYRSQDYLLGDWIGSNADRSVIFAEYTPIPRLKALIQYQHIRKGSAGSIEQQYYAEPQPEFLFGLNRTQTEVRMGLSYQIVHNVYAQSRYTMIKDQSLNPELNTNFFNFGISIGM
ncbi:capsule assembly Wzi family protein [Daejeonella sp.]|uniref:capsule assembly Wzi family protein n=1 Tax=Daejeonella sp. TaxID=2805397 RepID=UPI003983C4C7